jgi:hypothetical protein
MLKIPSDVKNLINTEIHTCYSRWDLLNSAVEMWALEGSDAIHAHGLISDYMHYLSLASVYARNVETTQELIDIAKDATDAEYEVVLDGTVEMPRDEYIKELEIELAEWQLKFDEYSKLADEA